MFSESMFFPSFPVEIRTAIFPEMFKIKSLAPPFQKFQILTGYDPCSVTIQYYWHWF